MQGQQASPFSFIGILCPKTFPTLKLYRRRNVSVGKYRSKPAEVDLLHLLLLYYRLSRVLSLGLARRNESVLFIYRAVAHRRCFETTSYGSSSC